jgi:hypothetical protein
VLSDQPGVETSRPFDLVERVTGGGRRSKLHAIALGLAGLAIVVSVTVGLGMSYTRLTESGVIAFGRTAVRYSHGGTRAEARAIWDMLVAEYLVEPGDESRSNWAWTFDVRREAGRRVVEIEPQGDLTSDDPELDCVIFMNLLSSKAFADEPLDIWLRDKARGRDIKVPWEDRRRRLVTAAGHTVEYRNGGQESEASQVARILEEHHLFEVGQVGVAARALVKRTGATHVVGLVIDVSYTGGVGPEQVLRVKAQLRSLAETFSPEVFGGQAVDIWVLYDDADTVPSPPPELLCWDTRPSAPTRCR